MNMQVKKERKFHEHHMIIKLYEQMQNIAFLLFQKCQLTADLFLLACQYTWIALLLSYFRSQNNYIKMRLSTSLTITISIAVSQFQNVLFILHPRPLPLLTLGKRGYCLSR